MIEIVFNGEKQLIETSLSLQDILNKNGWTTDNYFAVALNRSMVPRNTYSSTQLNHSDVINIITPMQGG